MPENQDNINNDSIEEEVDAGENETLDDSMPDAVEDSEYGSVPSSSKPQMTRNQRNIKNNEETLRAANEVLRDKNIPYASAIAAGLDTADKISGGRSTRILARHTNLANKVLPGGRKVQKAANRLNESGANNLARKVNGYRGNNTNKNSTNDPNKAGPSSTSTPKSNTSSNNDAKGEFTIKLPLTVKIAMYGAIFGGALLALMIFIVVFNEEGTGSGGALGGEYTYGSANCTTITVIDTECDSEGDNCTNIHNGEVDIEDYVAGVVAAEAEGANNLEFYKLVAVKARTYFFENANSNCKVKGNVEFQEYVDISTSSNSELIKQAVEETKDLVAIKDEKLLDISYNYGKIINADANNYYLEFYTKSSSNKQTQTIPKEWGNQSIYSNYLKNWQSTTESKGKGISLVGSLYLITNENYTYEDVIAYYYGEEISLAENKMQLVGSSGFMNPTSTIYCSSPFGPRIHPVSGTSSPHTGLDIALGGGTPIYAAADGIVTRVVNNVSAINNCNYGYGNNITIDHGEGISTLYAHMKYGSISSNLKVGDIVKQGEQIGQIGSTGCSTGNHLHYEVILNGERVDPTDYMDLTNASGTCKR